jgi:hypothetical protein
MPVKIQIVSATTHICEITGFANKSATFAHKRSNAQTAQRALASVAVVLPSLKNARNEVTAACLDETVHENTLAVVSRASLTTRIRAQDVIDPYQINQTRLKAQHPRWSMISSDAQLSGPMQVLRIVSERSLQD